MTIDKTSPAADSRRGGQPRAENCTTHTLQDKFDRLLAKARPTKRELIQQCFLDLYPKLEAYLSKGTLLKEVLAAFNALAHAKVCTRTFKEMLDLERGRRDHEGNPACCKSCGNRLKPSPAQTSEAPVVPTSLVSGDPLVDSE